MLHTATTSSRTVSESCAAAPPAEEQCVLDTAFSPPPPHAAPRQAKPEPLPVVPICNRPSSADGLLGAAAFVLSAAGAAIAAYAAITSSWYAAGAALLVIGVVDLFPSIVHGAPIARRYISSPRGTSGDGDAGQ